MHADRWLQRATVRISGETVAATSAAKRAAVIPSSDARACVMCGRLRACSTRTCTQDGARRCCSFLLLLSLLLLLMLLPLQQLSAIRRRCDVQPSQSNAYVYHATRRRRRARRMYTTRRGTAQSEAYVYHETRRRRRARRMYTTRPGAALITSR